MDLPAEITTKVDGEIASYNDELLIIYNKTYTRLVKEFPNGYYNYMAERSLWELKKRGLEPNNG